MICRGWIPKVRPVSCNNPIVPCTEFLHRRVSLLSLNWKGNNETAATSPDNGDESQETGGTSGSASSSSAQPTEAKNLAHKDVAIQIGTIFDKIKEENAREKQ